jgi:hypothetical protein
MSDYEEYTAWADMEREAEEIITESMRRPLTPDEAACLAFHARVRCIKPRDLHA